MTAPNAVPYVTSILHPTDFSEASQQAFVRAQRSHLDGPDQENS